MLNDIASVAASCFAAIVALHVLVRFSSRFSSLASPQSRALTHV
jgi:hypothetical protein